MRRSRWATRLLAFCALAGGAQVMGCFPFDFSESTGATTGGDGGTKPPACPGDPVAEPDLVRNNCGIFVSASAAPGGDGTMEKPFKTFAEAAGRGATRIYACAEAYDEAAGLKFSGGAEIFAGFTDCGPTGAWAWGEASKATLNGAANEVALTLDGGDYLLRNLNVKAADATTAGASSIAVVVNKGKLNVVDGDLTAGAARDGAAGQLLDPDMALNGGNGDPGVGVCGSGINNPGPMGKTKMCSTGGTSVSGKGGDGGELMGMTLLAAQSGGDGTPANAAQPTKGKGGEGEGQGTPAATECSDGTSGASGAPGQSGTGAVGAGALSISGYAGVEGTPGMSGKPGQGGGGGGGAKGGTNITCPGAGTASRVGGSGGAGGSGGCGGAGGGGGKAGGSSIALVALDTTVNLSGVTLSAGRAGNGGAGGDGQTGGLRGEGGNGGSPAGTAKGSCSGGDGGDGGPGGPGGGGQGGHSLGIALQGGTAPVGGTFQVDAMNKGGGGPGGLTNDTPMNGKGADGMATNCWDFAKNASCGG